MNTELTSSNGLSKPQHFTAIKEQDFEEFRDIVLNNLNQFIDNLRKGYVYIIRNVIDDGKLIAIRNCVHELGLTTPSCWHDVDENTPNFHQIDDELHYFKQTKRAHTYHFFKNNNDEFGLFSLFQEPLQLYQLINGHRSHCSSDTQFDKHFRNRLQIHHYPSGGGYMNLHRDADDHLKTIAIACMSEYGKDYTTGGLCLTNDANELLDIESTTKINIGDMIFAYPTIEHGCSPIDQEATLDWTSLNGRWLFVFNTFPIPQ